MLTLRQFFPHTFSTRADVLCPSMVLVGPVLPGFDVRRIREDLDPLPREQHGPAYVLLGTVYWGQPFCPNDHLWGNVVWETPRHP